MHARLLLISSWLALLPNASFAGDIFTPPGEKSAQCPHFSQANDRETKLRQAVFGAGKDALPTFNQIRQIPSLTPDQRRDIRKVFTDARESLQPLMAQAKEMREKLGITSAPGGDGPGGGPPGGFGAPPDAKAMQAADPATREKMRDLQEQIRAKRAEVWQQFQGMLTPAQFEQLQSMRRGEMVPSTFHGSEKHGE